MRECEVARARVRRRRNVSAKMGRQECEVEKAKEQYTSIDSSRAGSPSQPRTLAFAPLHIRLFIFVELSIV